MCTDREPITHKVRLSDAVVLTDVFTETQKYRLQGHLYNTQFYFSPRTLSLHGLLRSQVKR